MGSYRLSGAAKADVRAIDQYSEETFGPHQAELYIEGLERAFRMLANFPRTGTSAGDLRPGLFRFPYQSHVIFYSIESNEITIRRVLHGRMNFKPRF
jgi:toxin ParE1/3/4